MRKAPLLKRVRLKCPVEAAVMNIVLSSEGVVALNTWLVYHHKDMTQWSLSQKINAISNVIVAGLVRFNPALGKGGLTLTKRAARYEYDLGLERIPYSELT